MANAAVDQDQHWLINCLNATLDTNQQVRSFAETSLNQASLQPGFGSGLAKVAANRDLPFGLRQLAAVLLKQFIKKHWQEDEDTFEHPVVSSEEKAAIRPLLLSALDDPNKKICTAISMAVASIGHYDWPDDWPDLLPLLLQLIGDQYNMNGVHGALRCLALLSGDLDDTMMPTLIRILFPCLYTIVSSPQIYDKHLRTKALSIVYSCTCMLGVMSGVFKTETTELMSPMIPSWMNQFSVILANPVQSEDPDDWSMRIEVLKCLNQFVKNFRSLTEAPFSAVVGPLWQTFVTSIGVYESSSIEGTNDSYDGRYDSDGADKSLESFVMQLFEFLLTLVGSRKFVKVFTENMEDLIYHVIAFLQMTEHQIQTWSLDANQYIADEDENSYSCRISGSLLLEELVHSCGIKAIDAIFAAAKRRFYESQRAKASGSIIWWRIREATIYALASLSEQLLEAEVSGLGNLLEQIIVEDTGTGVNEFPFLFARVFSAVAKFSSVISSEVVNHFLEASMKAIGMDVPPPVKVGACRALCELLPGANKGVLEPHLIGLFSSLTDLLNQASDETMHLVLETLQAAAKAGNGTLATIEPILSPILLNTWAQYVSDPFVSIGTLEVLEAIKEAPGCACSLVSRVLPFVGPLLSKPHQQPEGSVAAALDLVTMLLKNSPVDVVKPIYDVCFDSIVGIILQADDHSQLQNATQCLAALISGSQEKILGWGVDPGFTMRSLLDVASRLLDPSMESSGSLFAGSFILQLILHLPTQMAQHIRDLVAALVRRLQSCIIAGLRSSLILIFARLVHMSSPNVEQFIDLLISVPAEGHDNAFAYVMSEWTKQQGEVQGFYQIKVTTSALALLLSSKHVQLGKVSVQGYLIKTSDGIITRSKAKSAPDQWTWIPLPAKIMALLADALMEIQEPVLGGDDEDSEWEDGEAEDVELKHDFVSTTLGISPSMNSNDYLDALAKVVKEDEDDDDEDDLLSSSDPLNKINLTNYLADFFLKFSQSERQLFDHLCQSLTKPQLNAIEMVLKR
ncbi:importin-9-like [Impatiens glandulifera]|uniref:importin-9-like n=1 Tax=Impatiens glandulifera TaxID=253017 RepID=UPI001FB13FC6|nr:importin-9-like [Impatiens glandulifera]